MAMIQCAIHRKELCIRIADCSACLQEGTQQIGVFVGQHEDACSVPVDLVSKGLEFLGKRI